MMINNIEIIIFLPVKNGIKYIEEAVYSVLAQLYVDYRFVILDNNSSDGTKEYIEGIIDRRVEKIYSNSDLTIFESWVRIYNYVKFKGITNNSFITTIGHDDKYHKDFLSTIIDLIKHYPNNDVYQTNFNIIDGKSKVVRSCMPIPMMETARDFLLARCFGYRDSFGTGYVFRASQYLNVGGFKDFPLLLWSDDLLVYKAIGSSFKVCSSKICFSYRLHSSSASGSQSWKTFSDYHVALNLFLKELECSEEKNLKFDEQLREGLSILICRTLEIYGSFLYRIPKFEKLAFDSFQNKYGIEKYPKYILTPLRPSYRKILTMIRNLVKTLNKMLR